MKIKKQADRSRRGEKRKANPIIVILCEGKETEVAYFEKFNSRYTRVEVKVADRNSRGKDKSRATDPESLVKRSINIKNNKYDINKEDGDRFWCVFDVDINYNNDNAKESKISSIEKASNLANRNDILLGISNPCFELWYLMHFEYTTSNLKDYGAVKTRLEKYISNYSKQESFYDDLKERVFTAIKNGYKLKHHHETLGQKLPDMNDTKYKLNAKDIANSNPYTNIVDLINYMEEIESYKSKK